MNVHCECEGCMEHRLRPEHLELVQRGDAALARVRELEEKVELLSGHADARLVAEARVAALEEALRQTEREMIGIIQRLCIDGVAVVPGYQADYLAKDIEAAVEAARKVLDNKYTGETK